MTEPSRPDAAPPDPQDRPDAASLAEAIIGAEKRPVHPRAKADFPNPVGGFGNILYPVRRYVLWAFLLLIALRVLSSLWT